MAGAKLDQAKEALKFCIANLNDIDKFQIVRFSTEAEGLFDAPLEATKENRDRALKFIDDLSPPAAPPSPMPFKSRSTRSRSGHPPRPQPPPTT